VIVKGGRIISVGWNGAPCGDTPCTEIGKCDRLNKPSNSGDYSDCRSVHAEQAALIYANGADMVDATLYLWGEERNKCIGCDEYQVLTYPTPCPICSRLLKEAGIHKVVTVQNAE